MRIWERTEQSSWPEIRLDGGRRCTSSVHAAFRLTEGGKKQQSCNILCCCCCFYSSVGFLLTGEDNSEDDGDVNEEELEVSQITENLLNISKVTEQQRNQKKTTIFVHIYYKIILFLANHRAKTSSLLFYRVEQRDTEVLDDAVESHELEYAEGGDEGSPALSSQRKEMAVRRVWELSLNVFHSNS